LCPANLLKDLATAADTSWSKGDSGMHKALVAVATLAGWVATVLLVVGFSQQPLPRLEVLSVDVAPSTTTTAAVIARSSGGPDTTEPPTVTTTTGAAPVSTTPTVAPTTTTTIAPTTTTTVATTTTTARPATTTTTKPAPTTTAAPAGSYSAQAEAEFFSLINQLRASQGLGSLSSHSGLTAYARDWSLHMATTGSFGHSNIASLLGPWSTAGENIAKGGSVSALFEALKASPGHYANMVSQDYTHLGVGVWIDASGTIWATHVFGG
jgi:uncharacterized protein YkwD